MSSVFFETVKNTIRLYPEVHFLSSHIRLMYTVNFRVSFCVRCTFVEAKTRAVRANQSNRSRKPVSQSGSKTKSLAISLSTRFFPPFIILVTWLLGLCLINESMKFKYWVQIVICKGKVKYSMTTMNLANKRPAITAKLPWKQKKNVWKQNFKHFLLKSIISHYSISDQS